MVEADGLRHRPPRGAKAMEREIAESRCQQAWTKAVMKDKLIDKNSDIFGESPILSSTRDPVRTLMVRLTRAVDGGRRRTNGRYCLTGSINPLLVQRVFRPLAGSATYVPFWPLTRSGRLELGTCGIVDGPSGDSSSGMAATL